MLAAPLAPLGELVAEALMRRLNARHDFLTAGGALAESRVVQATDQVPHTVRHVWQALLDAASTAALAGTRIVRHAGVIVVAAVVLLTTIRAAVQRIFRPRIARVGLFVATEPLLLTGQKLARVARRCIFARFFSVFARFELCR